MPRDDSTAGRFAADERGVSEVIGYILVISLVVSTIGIVSVTGISILTDAQSAEQTQTAQRAFDLLAENMADIYRQGAPSRSTEINLGSAQVVLEETTTVTVSGKYDGSPFSRSFNVSTITYRRGDTGRLVYDTGAVFRVSEDGSGVAFRELPFIVDENQTVVTIPQTTSDGISSVSGSTVLIRAKRTDSRVVLGNTSDGWEDLKLTVESPHWQAWKEALSERPDVSCTKSGTDEITCSLLSGASPDRFYLTVTEIRVSLVR